MKIDPVKNPNYVSTVVAALRPRWWNLRGRAGR